MLRVDDLGVEGNEETAAGMARLTKVSDGAAVAFDRGAWRRMIGVDADCTPPGD